LGTGIKAKGKIRKDDTGSKGFTLIELIVVITLLGIVLFLRFPGLADPLCPMMSIRLHAG